MDKYNKGNARKRKVKTGGWISKNRLLVGDTKNVTARNPNFDTDETKLLISLYGDPKFQKTLITSHRKHTVLKTLADVMAKHGYHRSVEELSTRIKNLKCFYNRLKKEYETGIGSVQPTWKHYEAMDIIMNRRVFSVHPDEIAEPSLKYRLEQEQHEHEKKCKLLQNSDGDKSSNDQCDCKYSSIKMKQEICSDDIDRKTDVLLVPKQEIIDINDSDDDEFYVDSSQSNSIVKSNIIIPAQYSSVGKSISSISASAVESLTKSQHTITNQQSPIQAQFGKISLVPANLLMEKKNTENITAAGQQLQTVNGFPCVQNQSKANARIVTNKSNGMKVLLLNTAEKMNNSNTSIIQNSTQQAFTDNVTINHSRCDDIAEEDFEGLITTLIAVQAESIDIQQQQLEVERERLHCQKSLADKIFKNFPLIGKS